MLERQFVGRLAADLSEIFVYGLAVEDGNLVYLDMFGISQSLDAVYMRLLARGESLYVVPDAGDSIEVRAHGTYDRSYAKVQRGKYNLVMQRRTDHVRGYFVVMDGSPVPYLLAGAKTVSAVPIRKHWADWLFEAAGDADATLPVEKPEGKAEAKPATAASLVEKAEDDPEPVTGKPSGLPLCCPCLSYGGVRAYSYSANPVDWELLITRGIKTGQISF